MNQNKNVAVVGATGAVGVEMLETLAKRNFPVKSLRLLASSRSAGKPMTYRGETIKVEELTKDSFKGIDIALFSAGASRSREFAQFAVDAGAVVVDNSSAFRMDPSVPLIVPEVNPEDIKKHHGVIANPNCTTIIMLVAIKPLYDLSPIKRIVVSTYQSASGAGAKGMEELEQQTAAVLAGQPAVPQFFPHPYAFNLFSHNTAIQANGYNEEELKMVYETRKIMHDDAIRVCPTCVRVPVLRSHSEAITIEQVRKVSVEEARAALAKAPGVKIVDDREKNLFPMPCNSNGQYDVLVGRIREDLSCDNGLALFVCGDQLLKGAALNAVQIAELL
ncbi:aspartate-semialdehyde dehydrogenase [Oligosphaera ethanolica]|uniref:Aspartate-semialdehyde dehydrogenase n=1 Tax=Oligosphaera ethanolica TaxID=760260 RepID=A0AAE3VFK2_9BACT|nr:aspartate-semialdehyde dehydrogenase [Oligosphaera ethanolica]MDQ0289593.1 aspartate-semialdehyde dehydrogenase [Oligosphaera ethanolica]